MLGIGWPSIIIFVVILMSVAAMARAVFEVGWANRKPGLPPASRGEKLAVEIIFAIIIVQLDVLAVHGLHVLKNRIGGWNEVISLGGAISFCGLVLAFLWWTFLGPFFYAVLPRRKREP